MVSRDGTSPHGDERFEGSSGDAGRDVRRVNTPSNDRRLRTGVKALVTGADRALLVKERHDDGSTFWTLPGGGLRPDERPADGLRRELDEELGCRVLVGEPLTSVWYHHRHTPAVTCYEVFDCSLLTEPAAERMEGVIGYRWVPFESAPASTLPQVRCLLRTTARR
ncbi:NUDIX hydrolase [Haloglomus litoreum]|uniref:NUDIX hydrolase n=1 Tax=Haloglomus litoreum TaxID=3034026 RepID=UPI0023E82904|nr:NUDIX domain-containing protein [Haloglomus sp. DT116]